MYQNLKRLVEDEGYAGAVHEIADAIIEVANEEDDEMTSEVMRIMAQRLRDVVGPIKENKAAM